MISPRAPRFLVLTMAVLAATGLSACSDDAAPDTSVTAPVTSSPSMTSSTSSTPAASSPTSESSSSTSTSPSTSTAPSTPAGPSASLAEGQQEVTAEESKISFGVPEEWVAIDPTALQNVDDADMPSQIVDMAKAQGMTTGQYLSQLATQMDLMVISPEPQGGFSDNINVLKTALPSMPTERDITAQLTAIGGKLEKAGSLESPLGEHPTYRYTLPTPDLTAHGMFILVEVDNGVRILTVSAGSEKRLQDIVDGVSSSLTTL